MFIFLISVDGQWGAFGSWSSCSQTCGGGKRTRHRQCNNPPPSNGGLDCKGRAVRRRKCNKDPCPGKKSVFNDTNCVVHVLYIIVLLCLVNGKWGKWTVWSPCSQTCGGGIRTRQRECNNPPPSNGGEDCKGKEMVQRKCNRKPCPGQEQRKHVTGFSKWVL